GSGARVAGGELAFGYVAAHLLTQRVTLGGTAAPSVGNTPPPAALDAATLDALAARARLPSGPLRALDRVVGVWPEGGRAGLGHLRGELDLAPDAWYFRDHTFQDPTFPTSLAIEAILQLFRLALTHLHPGDDPDALTFDVLALDEPTLWRSRGQIGPDAPRICIDLELTEVPDGGEGVAAASAWVSCEGRTVVHAERV